MQPGDNLYQIGLKFGVSWVEIAEANYNVYFLDDFMHLLKGLNKNYYGMLDQRIASRGRIFM